MVNIPDLKVNKPGTTLRVFGHFSEGVAQIGEQIAPYTKWWNTSNKQALGSDGKLLVVVGDSAALGIGASKPENGYSELVRQHLETNGEKWRVIVLAQSGAKAKNALREYLPTLEKLEPDLVISCIGSNDVFWSLATRSLIEKMERIVNALPQASVIGKLAGASPRAKIVNAKLKQFAKDRRLPICDPWRVKGVSGKDRVASDNFHPNDYGYELMASAFIEAINSRV